MGLWDKLKQVTVGEAARLFLQRPDEAKGWVVYRWPDTNIRLGTQCTVEADEVAVFLRDGNVVGTLPPGRHTLDGLSIPWVSLLVDAITGGNLFVCEVYFVTTRQLHGVKFGGEIGRVKDPETELRVRLRAFGECTVEVADPAVLLTRQTGLGELRDDGERFKRIVGERVMLALSDDVGELVAKKGTALDLVLSGALKEELIEEAKRGVDGHLQEIGLQVAGFQRLEINPDDTDWQQLQHDAADLRAMRRDARRAQLMNEVEIERRAKLSLLAGGYQPMASGEAMIGAGAGLAQGGESSGTALGGAGLGIGLAMAGQLAQGLGNTMAHGAPVQQGGGMPSAPVVAGLPGANTAALTTCPSCQAQVPQGRFCGSCGTQLSPAACSCGAAFAPGAKFCSSCGKPAA